MSEEEEKSQRVQTVLMGDPATYIFNRCLKIHIFRLKILIFASQNLFWASLVAQWQRIRLSMQEMWVWTLCWEDPLEGEMATHPSILAWEIPWTEKPGRLQPIGCKELDTTE